jgi:AbiV family abortive infection protein
VDLAAVKEAPVRELARAAVTSTRNASGLVEDAELLSGAGRLARAYSLAGLAVEEVGKAKFLAALAVMPENLRARAPVGRMLEWHQMKLVTGQLVAAVPISAPSGLPTTFMTMPLSEVTAILDDARATAQEVDHIKQRGLYVDVDRYGHVRDPSEVTAAEVRDQLGRARRAASAAKALLDPTAARWLTSPDGAAVDYSRALVSAFDETRHARSPEAAADVLLNMASKLH